MAEYKRYCKTLNLEDDPKLIEEYKKVHAPGAAWPEVKQGMRKVGIIDMEIYIHRKPAYLWLWKPFLISITTKLCKNWLRNPGRLSGKLLSRDFRKHLQIQQPEKNGS
jgi:L-rhamnose mutarotase